MPATATIVGGRYLLGPVIGRGGAADVYQAEDTESGRPVAVKMLRAATTDDLQRFDREVETLSRLDHPAIVRMCDRGEHEGVPYLVLDLIDGESLSQVLRRGALSEPNAIRIAAVLADALAYAHARGIVHRDVKPGNVLLDHRGDVHLTDFGIALLTDVNTITSTGHVIGTAAYLAPEQVTGDGTTAASDVYALGLVLIEMLTGEPAFRGTASEVAYSRLHRRPAIPASASPALGMLLDSMTATDPTLRPPTTAVAETLSADRTAVLPLARDVTEAIPIEPNPSRVVTPAPPFVGRARRRLIVFLAISAVVVLGLLGWSMQGDSVAPANTTPTVPSTTVPAPTTAAPTTAPPSTAPKHGKKRAGDN